MKFRTLFALFLSASIVKLLFALTINSPHIVFDESILFIESQSIWHNHSYFSGMLYGFPQYPPLYLLIISPTAVFTDVVQSFKAILVMNCFISSTAIFPVYYLAKEYLPDRETQFTVILMCILPSCFLYSYAVMCENLFVLLFFCSVYFIKKTTDENSFRNNTLTGIFISLTVLTKLTGLVLVVVYVIVKIFMYYKENIRKDNK